MLEGLLDRNVPEFDTSGLPCRGKTDLFFSNRKADVREAQRMCGTCPEQYECAAYALTLKLPDGTWGGISAAQRKALIKQNRIDRRELASERALKAS